MRTTKVRERNAQITVKIPFERIEETIADADIRCWGKRSMSIRDPLAGKITDLEANGEEYRLTKENVLKGLEIIAHKYPNHFRDIIACTGDAFTGDALIQCAIFGDIKYE